MALCIYRFAPKQVASCSLSQWSPKINLDHLHFLLNILLAHYIDDILFIGPGDSQLVVKRMLTLKSEPLSNAILFYLKKSFATFNPIEFQLFLSLKEDYYLP